MDDETQEAGTGEDAWDQAPVPDHGGAGEGLGGARGRGDRHGGSKGPSRRCHLDKPAWLTRQRPWLRPNRHNRWVEEPHRWRSPSGDPSGLR